MTDINIVTPYDGYNFGALLQAYALLKVVSELAQDQSVGIYRYDIPVSTGAKTLKRKILEVCRKIHEKEIVAGDSKFDLFRHELFEMNSDTESQIYIAGSDQIWNPNNYQGKFFLDFVSSKSIKASYAASMGVTNVDVSRIEKVGKSVSEFDFISVREEDARNTLKQYVDKEILVNVDPTLLLTKEEWRNIEAPVHGIVDEYVLVYFLHIPKYANRYVNAIRKKTKKKIVLIDRTGMLRYAVHADLALADIGPREFLWLIDHASYTITSSFHGTVFSLIFEKEFLPLINPDAPSRINNLLTLLQISNEVSVDSPFPVIGYKAVKETLADEQIRSKEYLRNVIQSRKDVK